MLVHCLLVLTNSVFTVYSQHNHSEIPSDKRFNVYELRVIFFMLRLMYVQ